MAAPLLQRSFVESCPSSFENKKSLVIVGCPFEKHTFRNSKKLRRCLLVYSGCRLLCVGGQVFQALLEGDPWDRLNTPLRQRCRVIFVRSHLRRHVFYALAIAFSVKVSCIRYESIYSSSRGTLNYAFDQCFVYCTRESSIRSTTNIIL